MARAEPDRPSTAELIGHRRRFVGRGAEPGARLRDQESVRLVLGPDEARYAFTAAPGANLRSTEASHPST
ncbi:hypothetical protein [Streptomyces sp. NPDC059092]|uniref:hypothetical protein n=1 Tax=Streptomyces sp. NPDC059092 TaxID=3346725 RepID=UPI0036C85678